MTTAWPLPPSPDADWDTLLAYCDALDPYRRIGSVHACFAIATAVERCRVDTGDFPRDAGALALALFVAVRRYQLAGSPDGTAHAYLRDLLHALQQLSLRAAA